LNATLAPLRAHKPRAAEGVRVTAPKLIDLTEQVPAESPFRRCSALRIQVEVRELIA
jgi:hypothetical protein